MHSNLAPEKGLAVFSSYNIHTKRGKFFIIDLKTGYSIAEKYFHNAITSENIISLLGICRACQFSIENNYIEKVYITNSVSYTWARNKRFKTKVSSRGMTKLMKENLEILSMHDFTEVITMWDSNWGNMRDRHDPSNDLPF